MLFKGQKIVVALGVWAMLELALLVLFRNTDYAYFFALAFLGYLVITATMGPYVIRPRWKSRLNYVTIAGALVFLLIVAQKTVEFWGA